MPSRKGAVERHVWCMCQHFFLESCTLFWTCLTAVCKCLVTSCFCSINSNMYRPRKVHGFFWIVTPRAKSPHKLYKALFFAWDLSSCTSLVRWSYFQYLSNIKYGICSFTPITAYMNKYITDLTTMTLRSLLNCQSCLEFYLLSSTYSTYWS